MFPAEYSFAAFSNWLSNCFLNWFKNLDVLSAVNKYFLGNLNSLIKLWGKACSKFDPEDTACLAAFSTAVTVSIVCFPKPRAFKDSLKNLGSGNLPKSFLSCLEILNLSGSCLILEMSDKKSGIVLFNLVANCFIIGLLPSICPSGNFTDSIAFTVFCSLSVTLGSIGFLSF